MLGKRTGRVGPAGEHRQQPGHVRKVPGNQNIARLSAQTVFHPLRRIGWLHIARGGQCRKRVAFSPEGFSRLSRAQLSTVPDHRRTRTERRGLPRQTGDVVAPPLGERPARIDIGANGVAVVHEKKRQGVYAFSPAGMRTVRRFSASGNGHVVYALNAQGGL